MTQTVEKIDARKALDLLADAVETRGEGYVYQKVTLANRRFPSCVYVDNEGRPSCLVGVALHLAGVDVMKIPNSIGADVLPWQVPELVDVLTPAAAKVFAVAQRVQDQGGTWGAAFNAAEAVLDFGLVQE